MSAPSSLQQQQQFYVNATSCQRQQEASRMSKGKQIDLIEAKFNQLARKILAELQQNSPVSQRFFVALDSILQEAEDGNKWAASTGRPLARSASKKQLEQQEELARKCDILLAKQKMQQDQLDSHQQILFDKQFESLPSQSSLATTAGAPNRSGALDKTNRRPGGVRKTATTSQLASGTKTNEKKASEPTRLRSAIPTSTILSGISQLSKSATTGNFVGAAGAQSARQPSLRPKSVCAEPVSNRTNGGGGGGGGGGEQTSKPTGASQRSLLSASEKLKQRRPTKASILDNLKPQQSMDSDDDDVDDDVDDDDDDDDDDEEDDDSYEYQSLASRRAFLNERFIDGPAESQVAKSKTFSELKASETGEQTTNRVKANSTTSGGPKLEARTGPSFNRQAHKTRSGRHSLNLNEAAFKRDQLDEPAEPDDPDDPDGPRSINGLLAGGPGGGMMYKAHMNYSQSLLGNHRLSDDDEIIIIPTAQSPTPSLLMSASPSPLSQSHKLQPHQKQRAQDDSSNSNNLDELNERFSISRTKSFWEKLANSKRLGGSDVQATTSSPQQASDSNNNNNNNNNNSAGQLKLIHQQHSTASSRSAFDRLDSTGGSSSHQSGCSSSSNSSSCTTTSGDEQANRQLRPAIGGNLATRQPATARASAKHTSWPAQNPAISQLVHEEHMQRSDRFRQTR